MKIPFKFIFIFVLVAGLLLDIAIRYNARVAPRKQPEIDSMAIEMPTFQSLLYEPVNDFNFSKNLYEDFNSDRTTYFDDFKIISAEDVRILSLKGEEEFRYLFEKLPFCKDIEALEIVDINVSNSDLDRLINELSDKKHFKKLSLVSCNITTLPASIASLTALETLKLPLNPSLKTLPPEIGQLYTLKNIIVRNARKFEVFPPEIGQLTNLEMLDFSGTSVKALPPEIGGCANLVHITGNASKLKTIPPEIGNCFKLKYINWSYNKIEEVPVEIGQLSELKHLSLGGNRLSDIPPTFAMLRELGFCDLSRNQLTRFPKEVLFLNKVYNLWLHQNNFSDLPSQLRDMNALTHLLIDVSEINPDDLKTIKETMPELNIIEQD